MQVPARNLNGRGEVFFARYPNRPLDGAAGLVCDVQSDSQFVFPARGIDPAFDGLRCDEQRCFVVGHFLGSLVRFASTKVAAPAGLRTADRPDARTSSRAVPALPVIR
ncbi:hypothetical protein ACQVP2_27450 [Methylobacterium aquaticum]|uniref:hypothetical protein n=1 Tax=Methylobacterium aquaticum TaxID=270351 RepID=UPI003D17830C